jgi:hypothetical protein
MIIGPQIFASTFAYFISRDHHMPSAPWYLAALLLAISLVIAVYVAGDKKGRKERVDTGFAPGEAEAS